MLMDVDGLDEVRVTEEEKTIQFLFVVKTQCQNTKPSTHSAYANAHQ